jgi:inhibitor of KinA
VIQPPFQVHQAGDTAIIVEFGELITSQINALVLDYSQQIEAMEIPGVIETVPTFRSLMIEYDPDVIATGDLISSLAHIAPRRGAARPGRKTWQLPVCYEGECAMDLEEVAARLNLTPEDVVARHVAVTYDVFMLGFLPGQPYLGELSPTLRLPRRTSPRLRIPGGSIGIATSLTCVFPAPTPCGWHIIGRTPIPMWDLQTDRSPIFAPGDRIQLQPIGFDAYADYVQRIARDGYRLLPLEGGAPCPLH